MRKITYRDAIKEALEEEMRRDDNVFLIGEDIADPFGGSFKVTKGLSTEFGTERVRNTPISEAGLTGAAVGAAIAGLRPVAEIMYIDFSGCCFDAIVNQAAKIRYMSGGQVEVPLVFRTQQGAGKSSAAQHAQSWEAIYAHIPGLKVVLPSTAYDVKGLLKTAIRSNDPVLFIEHKMLYGEKGEVPEEEYTIPFGKAEVRKTGSDVTIVAYSRMVQMALEAAKMLEKDGIDAEVIDLRTVVPLDRETLLNSIRKTGRLAVVHEAVKRCGFGAELTAFAVEEAFDYLDAPVVRVAAENTPVAFAPQLENRIIPNTDRIYTSVKKLFE
ncbi:alpha-ketoacid dehydrogenase subunit beta [Bacilliculturomica massiliensis]|uniref:alpha-ketoacid dehydrogenase subunit beta n=1 Tax=Bacilliculturomica massiliensis TaxID=1917867 RepID=UPI001030F59D|nr:alpha-ketoacid dehydrogenase subunit beta [Bacilliculturomica massiliensis]